MGAVPVAPETVDQIRSIAEILANVYSSSAVCQILGEHTPDATGHCRGCRYPTTAAPVWPCRLWEIANETEQIWKSAKSA